MFDYGYDKISTLRRDMNNAGLKKHGLINKPSNLILNNQEKYKEIKKALHFIFEKLRDEAETHATRVIREATGVGLRDEEIDTVELPSSFSKRQLYYRYYFHNGYGVKSDAKGNMPSMKNYEVRTTFNIHYPEGSVPKPVCDWKAFRTFWKDNYPKMTIRPPSQNTCAECWKYRNELGVVSRLQNEAARLQIRNNFDCENQLEDEDTNMNDQDDTTNEDHSNDIIMLILVTSRLKIILQSLLKNIVHLLLLGLKMSCQSSNCMLTNIQTCVIW